MLGSRRTGPMAVLLLVALTTGLAPSTGYSQNTVTIIDFDVDDLPAGTILSSVNASASGFPVGPILVNGSLPSDPGTNRAILFDSGNPTGGDFDLGTPNETFGGPGIGNAGEVGEEFANEFPLENLLIMGENLIDGDGDGLVDDPDDADEMMMVFELDFRFITSPTPLDSVTVMQLTTVDGETDEGEIPGFVRLFDAGGNLLEVTPLEATGCNGVRVHPIGPAGEGISGVARMEVELNGSGGIDDIVLEIDAGVPPMCMIDPEGPLMVEVGQPVSFSVTALSPNPGGTVILDTTGLPPGATMTPPLPLDSAPESMVTSVFDWTPAFSDVGTVTIDYTVVDNGGLMGGCSIDITVICNEIEIQQQPMDLVVCEGQPATFTVDASGTGPLTFQWRFDGTPIPGATMSSFTIPSVTLGDAGTYDVVITNPCGMATSDPATLEVLALPVITDHPDPVTVCEGEPATFEVVATGEEPLLYQWRKDGVEIPGATMSIFTIPMTTVDDQGVYDVLVSNDCGTAKSEPATLVVMTAPVIDMQPMDLEVCEGLPATFMVEASGSPPLMFQWRKDGKEIPGATESTFTIAMTTLDDAGTYDVVITNDCGTVISDRAALEVLALVAIIDQPDSQTVCAGEMVVFEVVAEGAPPLMFQWRKDGMDIPGATMSTLTIPMVTVADAGVYDVAVSNECNSVKSEPATLEVLTAPVIDVQPMDVEVCEGLPATFMVEASGSPPLMFQWRKDGIDIPGATMSTFTIPAVTPADAGIYDVVVTNTCGMAISDPAELVVLARPVIIDQPDPLTVCVGDPAVFEVVADGTPPLMFQWRKDGVDIPGATMSTFTILKTVRADMGVYDVVVTNQCGVVESDPAPLVVMNPPEIDVQPMDVEVCEGEPASFMVSAIGSPPLTFQWRKDRIDIPGATMSTFTIPKTDRSDAGNYDVVVTNDCASVVSDPAMLIVNNPPTIITQPQDMDVCEGDPVTFEVVVDGTDPLMFQWRFNGVAIPGATMSTFTIDPVSRSDEGTYDVVISNLCDEVTSDPAELIVNNEPTVVSISQDMALCPSEDLVLEVVAEGTPPLMFQWRLDGIDLDGELEPVLMIPGGEWLAGTYDVVVSNICGEVISAPVEVEQDFDLCPFVRGDCNIDAIIDLGDAIYIMRFLFQGLPPSICLDACDFDDDGVVGVIDVIFMVTYLFSQGDEPLAPFPDCGLDPTPDTIICELYQFCP